LQTELKGRRHSVKALRRIGPAILLGLLGITLWAVGERTTTLTPAQRRELAGKEISLVEQVVSARQLYLQNLDKLVAFYRNPLNVHKLKKAEEELATLKAVRQHRYIIVAEVLGPDIHPTKLIAEAEKLYKNARLFDTDTDPYKTAENKRKALELYLQIISQHPESLRIADAAWYTAGIYKDHLKDYYRAVVYYEKTYQWDPMTEHPARITAGRVAYYDLRDNHWAKKLYEVAFEKSPNATYRAEAKALLVHLKHSGY